MSKKRKIAWAPKYLKKCYFTIGMQQGKSGIHFPVFGERKENEAILSKTHFFRFGPKNLKKTKVTVGFQQRKLSIHVLVIGEKEMKMKPF